MKIKRLSYYDRRLDWKLESVDFFENLNLLVGVSGVGKTRTLQAIANLKQIANGESLNGASWDVCFIADNSLEYSWRGEFETKESSNPIVQYFEKEAKVEIIR
jgi:AAA15 family ATPase/GTPase